MRKQRAESIKTNFEDHVPDVVTVHWDEISKKVIQALRDVCLIILTVYVRPCLECSVAVKVPH